MNLWKLWRANTPNPNTPQSAPLDSDVTFYEQLRYLQELSDAIFDDTLLARDELGDTEFTTIVGWPLLEAVNIPIESKEFWDMWAWEDHVAQLLSLWRMDREMNALDRRTHSMNDLAQRMRDAASTLEKISDIYGYMNCQAASWSAEDLRREAEHVEADA